MNIRKFGSFSIEIAFMKGNAPLPVFAGGVCGKVKQNRPMSNAQMAARIRLSALRTWSFPERRHSVSAQPINTQETAPHMRIRK